MAKTALRVQCLSLRAPERDVAETHDFLLCCLLLQLPWSWPHLHGPNTMFAYHIYEDSRDETIWERESEGGAKRTWGASGFLGALMVGMVVPLTHEHNGFFAMHVLAECLFVLKTVVVTW